MAEDAEARRRKFSARAAALREALVAELSACAAAPGVLSPDEAFLLAHILACAGFTEAGDLRIPALAPLWGAAQSYLPPARLPAERTRAAARLLMRRAILRPVGDELAVDAAALRALASPASPPKPKARPKSARRLRPARRR